MILISVISKGNTYKMLGQIKAKIIGRCSPSTIIINGTISIFHNNRIDNYSFSQCAQKLTTAMTMNDNFMGP